MKNICFTIRNVDCRGGTERVGLNLANALAERGYNVFMVDYDSKRHQPFFYCDPRIKLWTILSHGGFERKMRWHFWYGAWKFRRFLKKNHIDVVIDIDTFNALWTASAVRGLDIKWISWDHFNLNYCCGKRREKALELVSKEADYLVLLSKADKASYLEKTSVPSEKIVQIYNPLSFECPLPIDHQGQKRVTAIGRIAPQKGFDLLLQSWLLVEKEVDDWTLEIVCGYGDWNGLQKEAEDMGCKHVVCSPPTQDIPGKLAKTAIFALSSRFEGFGLVITEAMTCSVPTVSYDCPQGPREIITDGEDGLLVEPENTQQLAEKMLALINDDEMRERMGKAAYNNCQRFSMSHIVEEWIKLVKG